ncbi:MAG TPA: SLBB domain-containing protein [Candidatus Eisenbacteria bacterium]|nr:SLBB domain-containing protein [Candidatus Eisenbacteria bacterium]
MKLRDSTWFQLIALVLIPAMVFVSLPSAVRAQALPQALPGIDQIDRPSTAPNVPMPVAVPSDTEVLQAERPVINPYAAPTLALEEPLDPSKYICGRGDVFELNFWGRQNFKLRVTVDLEGRTFISKVGYVDIVGKTLSQARTIVQKAVLRYFPGLNFDLSLAEPRTFLVHVVENIPHPGIYTARPVERASVVIARAGGIVGNASKRKISIRHRDGTTAVVDLLLYNLTGDTQYNPYLADGDLIRVPFEDVSVNVDGAVKRPGHYELVHGKDLGELIDLAGGLTSTATRQLPIKLVRRNDKERAQQIDVAYPADAGLPQFALQVDDAIHVPTISELQRSVLLIGAIAGASTTDQATSLKRLPFVEKDTVRTLLDRTGGVNAEADLKEGYIQHQDGNRTAVDLEALLVQRDFSADRPVQMGDSVVVPYKRRSILVEGAVFRPSQYPFNPKLNLIDYVANAGGPTRFAQEKEEIRLITPTGEMRAFAPDLKVNPGDTIVVPERNFSRSEIVALVMAGVGLALSAATLAVAFKK